MSGVSQLQMQTIIKIRSLVKHSNESRGNDKETGFEDSSPVRFCTSSVIIAAAAAAAAELK